MAGQVEAAKDLSLVSEWRPGVYQRSDEGGWATRDRSPTAQQRRPVDGVYRLQRALGNRALGRALRGQLTRSRTAVLARYDTGEHALFGGDMVVFEKDGLKITESEMITMGDLYETPEDLYQADIGELRRLVELIRRDKNAYLGQGGATHVSDDEWEAATQHGPHRKKTYLELAAENATHFGPRHSGHDWNWMTARDHKAEWQRIHKHALDIAHAAKTPAELQRAYAYNAFAAHFLTDAFAAGHLISKAEAMEQAQRSWARLHTDYMVFHENDLTRRVAENVLADRRAGQVLRGYAIKLVRWQDMSAEALSEVLWQFATTDKYREQFYDNFVKAVHDELNDSGVEVTNERGDGPWTLRGDTHLLPDDPWAVDRATYEASKASSEASLRVGRAAVAESVRNVGLASRTAGPIDFQKMFDRVWTYTPRPTENGWRHIRQVMDKLLDLASPATAAAFAQILIDHLDLLIRKLTDPSVDVLKPEEELSGLPGKPM
jgi:hypothetical protein